MQLCGDSGLSVRYQVSNAGVLGGRLRDDQVVLETDDILAFRDGKWLTGNGLYIGMSEVLARVDTNHPTKTPTTRMALSSDPLFFQTLRDYQDNLKSRKRQVRACFMNHKVFAQLR